MFLEGIILAGLGFGGLHLWQKAKASLQEEEKTKAEKKVMRFVDQDIKDWVEENERKAFEAQARLDAQNEMVEALKEAAKRQPRQRRQRNNNNQSRNGGNGGN